MGMKNVISVKFENKREGISKEHVFKFGVDLGMQRAL